MKLKNLLPPKARVVFEAGRLWRKHKVGKRILGTYEQTSEQIDIDEPEATMKLGRYRKLYIVAAGALLALGSKYVPALEDADAEMLVESVILALTALGVYRVPNED